MEVDEGMLMEGARTRKCIDSTLKLKKGNEGCMRCLELRDKCERLEFAMWKKHCIIRAMESKRFETDKEISLLKQRNQELEKNTHNVMGEDKVARLLVENNVLESAKNKAEFETEDWKMKCKNLEMKVMELEKGSSNAGLECGFNAAVMLLLVQTGMENGVMDDNDLLGTPPFNTSSLPHVEPVEGKGDNHCETKSGIRKGLDFTGEGSPSCNISPATPGGRSIFCPIYLTDSDDDLKNAELNLPCLDNNGRKEVCSSIDVGLRDTAGEKESASNEGSAGAAFVPCQTDKKDIKRRRTRRGVPYFVSSESESSSDDNKPISKLKSKHLPADNPETTSIERSKDNPPGNKPEELTRRRRLIRVRDQENGRVLRKHSSKSGRNQSFARISKATNETVSKNETEEGDSSSEGESLGGFIVNSSDVSESSTEGISESSVAYDEIISGLRRGRKDKLKWFSEGEMLADFGKYPELCMKAVCALYRQQTSDEKSFKVAIHVNRRGFSQSHASIGSALAEFLTGEDSQGDVKKSVKELRSFDKEGVENAGNWPHITLSSYLKSTRTRRTLSSTLNIWFVIDINIE